MSATNTGIGQASESTTINTDNSTSQTLANQAQYNDKYGADLALAQSSGNVFNLADPTLTIAATGIANSSLVGAFKGLERITDSSNLAVERSLDLAKTIQGGQGDQVTGLVKVLAYVVGAVIIVWVLIAAFRRKKKGNK